jgi:hypothetical protein
MVRSAAREFEDIPLIIPAVLAMSRKKPEEGRRGRGNMIQ